MRHSDLSVSGFAYLLICGERYFKAFKALGLQEIPAIVTNADREAAFIMSLTVVTFMFAMSPKEPRFV